MFDGEATPDVGRWRRSRDRPSTKCGRPPRKFPLNESLSPLFLIFFTQRFNWLNSVQWLLHLTLLIGIKSTNHDAGDFQQSLLRCWINSNLYNSNCAYILLSKCQAVYDLVHSQLRFTADIREYPYYLTVPLTGLWLALIGLRIRSAAPSKKLSTDRQDLP